MFYSYIVRLYKLMLNYVLLMFHELNELKLIIIVERK